MRAMLCIYLDILCDDGNDFCRPATAPQTSDGPGITGARLKDSLLLIPWTSTPTHSPSQCRLLPQSLMAQTRDLTYI